MQVVAIETFESLLEQEPQVVLTVLVSTRYPNSGLPAIVKSAGN
jgi:hypothetical protein